MKLGGGNSKKKDSVLSQRNAERVATAGRRGTKNFVDPNKVFVGGLPFDATEDDLMSFLQQHLGPSATRKVQIHSVSIIRDWKTQKSKGYGFVQFTDPMFATCAIEYCSNKMMNGRILTFNQGKKKVDPNVLFIKKNKKNLASQDDEEAAILAGTNIVEDETDEISTEIDEAPNEEEWDIEDFDDVDDAILFSDDFNEEDEFEYDGTFEDIYPDIKEPLTEEEMVLNREKRREVQKRKPRRKLPAKGFGVTK